MNEEELLTKLKVLHAELASLDDVDEPTREMLGQIASDINELVDRKAQRAQAPEPSDDTADGNAASTSDISDRIEKFETDHPAVTRFLAQMTDLLAMLGI